MPSSIGYAGVLVQEKRAAAARLRASQLREVCAGRGERSRSQLLLKLAGPENMLILSVHGLAVNGALSLCIVSKSVLDTLQSVKMCLIDALSVLF